MSPEATTAELRTLQSVMDKTAALIDGVAPDQLSEATPCSEWDVERLVVHLVGWADNFATRAEGGEPNAEPDSVTPGEQAGAQFRRSMARLIAASSRGERVPNPPSIPMLIAEYVVHGWDLATATGQPAPFTEQEAQPGLDMLKEILKPEYRGHGFDHEVEVAPDADTVTKLLAFTGRQP